MGLLGPLASLLGVEVDVLVQRVRESAVAYAAIGTFGVIAMAFLLVAIYTALAQWVGPIWSPLIIAVVALVIALILYIALRIQAAAAQRRREERRREAASSALVTSAALSALPELLNSSLVRNVGLPIAGYALLLMFMGGRKKPTGDAGPPKRN